MNKSESFFKEKKTNLINNENDAVLLRDVSQSLEMQYEMEDWKTAVNLEELRRAVVIPTFCLNWLDDHRCDFVVLKYFESQFYVKILYYQWSIIIIWNNKKDENLMYEN